MCLRKRWSEEEIEHLKQMYQNPDITRSEIEHYFDRSWSSIQNKVLALGLRRPQPNTSRIMRDYFRFINTEEKAYWLGFIAADGTVIYKPRHYYIALALQKRDLHWLERFRNTIAPDAKIYKSREAFVVHINCKEMVEDVMNHGILPNKSDSLTFPITIPKKFVTPFIIGYFDGDGSLIKNTYTWQWSLLGTLPFLTVAREYIQEYAEVQIREPVRQSKVKSPHLHTIRAYGQRAVAIDRVLNSSRLGLPRKHLP